MTEKDNYYNNRKSQKSLYVRVLLPIFLVLIVASAVIFFLNRDDGMEVRMLEPVFAIGPLWDDITAMAGGNTEFANEYAEVHRINILLLGENEELTDTIMLASFDYDIKRVDVVSVPRDTYYEREGFPDLWLRKINSIYRTEDINALATAVSNLLGGVPIHYYMYISDDGVAKIVDAMGGVWFDVPIDMKYEDPAQGLYIDIPKGEQRLDGAHAVQYLRYRKGYVMGDLGRVEAQQVFVKEAFKQCIGKNLPAVIKTAVSVVDTNLSASLASRIAGEAIGLSGDDIETYMAPGVPEYRDGASYVFLDEAAAAELLREIYNKKSPDELISGAAISGAAVNE